MLYEIEFLLSAAKELGALPRKVQRQIAEKIQALAENPRPAGVKYLKGEDAGRCRIRSGDYRIVYQIMDGKLLVVVVKIGNRKDVYR